MTTRPCFRRPRTTLCLLFAAALITALPCAAVADGPAEPIADQGRVLGTHATSGIVRAIEQARMVIARSGHRGDMVFTLTPSTVKEGSIVLGAVVSVRYEDSGKRHVATAIAVRRGKE